MATNIVNDNNNNHTLKTAQNVTIDDIIYGKIGAANEIDFYRIVFSGSGEIEFRLNIPAKARYYLRILNENAEILAEVNGAVGERRYILYNVQAGVPYIVRISPYNSTDLDPITYYNLQFIPTKATNISLNMPEKISASTNISCSKSPSNAYTEFHYTSLNSNVSISNSSITPNTDGVTIITATDSINNLVSSKLLIVDLLPTSAAVSIPTNKRCNWNQKHSGVTSLFGRSACTLVSGLDVANIYSNNSTGYTPSDMNSSTYWDNINGYTWVIPGPGRIKNKYTFSDNSPSNISVSMKAEYVRQSYIRYIKNEINNGRPVIVNLGTDNEHNHSVVAYKYMTTSIISDLKEAPTEMNKIMVYDPENGGYETNINGRDVTLWEAYRYNFAATNTSEFIIWSLRPTGK